MLFVCSEPIEEKKEDHYSSERLKFIKRNEQSLREQRQVLLLYCDPKHPY